MKKIILLSFAFIGFAFARSVVIDVVEHKPIYEMKADTQYVENCNNSINDYNLLGTAIGAVGGGVVGNQFGGGSGKKLATVAGAIAGGYAGNRVEGNIKGNQKSGCEYKEQKVDRKVLVGYRNIGYYKGKQYSKITEEKQSKIRIELK
ncbi:glycine zipper 2TM domain-containing protein [Campylobacter ureolyticus]|uniref:glycine zipper 2TM domain-containing protein n=1 Tax=Campylobacter ureolyticus TaxID=827 RepID=UPI00215B6306|nr:glycine zipper 2TM domain-containing protein [Campylobacter ureolyticus]MCR8699279.1 glycine zipper 2TM domain-containing protein [Campylobacter ureolyticus]